MRTSRIALSCLLLLAVAACGGDDTADPMPPAATTPPAATPPDTPPTLDGITVDHILIGVKNRKIPTGKSPEEAKAFAYDLLKQIEAGGDWAALKLKHSDDPPPGGPYTMLTSGTPDYERSIFMRTDMAPAFGDVGFALEVGEVGMADFDPAKSPFGYHIIKRIK